MLLVVLIVSYYPGLLLEHMHTHPEPLPFNIDQAKPSRVEVYLTLHKLSL